MVCNGAYFEVCYAYSLLTPEPQKTIPLDEDAFEQKIPICVFKAGTTCSRTRVLLMGDYTGNTEADQQAKELQRTSSCGRCQLNEPTRTKIYGV